MQKINIIGAGLAGCEAAYQASKQNIEVTLIDCKPNKMSEAHSLASFAELVCSNSLKSFDNKTASGLLKAEMQSLDSLLIKTAYDTSVKAGNALAVNRELFSEKVTNEIKKLTNVNIVNQEANDWDTNEYTIIATGPLTLSGLEKTMTERFGDNLHFYDAAAPIVSGVSIDYTKIFSSSRYGKGSDDYLNCPMNKLEYEAFVQALITAECVTLRDFEKSEIFSSCIPVELIAKSGLNTLRFGTLRPVGFTDPATGKRPYAVVQLRAENVERTMYNIVGFQTNLKFNEQKRVFSLIPGLENAEFLRFGVMHRNSYINAPKTINGYFQCLNYPKTFIAGQLCGVEGYVESMASGLLTGINVCRLIKGEPMLMLPTETILGSFQNYLRSPNANFQPMNANFGLLPPLSESIRDKDVRKEAYYGRSVKSLDDFKKANNLI